MSIGVFVRNVDGKELMPCSPRRARLLLKTNSAKIIGYKPFTIQLTYRTSNCVQSKDITVGVDPGYSDIGIAVAVKQAVIYKATIQLDNTCSDNLAKSKGAQNTRRKKLWFRKNKNNINPIRKKRKAKNIKKYKLKVKSQYNFTAPSIESRKLKHSYWIDKILAVLPIGVNLRIELGSFDAHKIQNPDISGIGYQRGDLYGWENTKSFVRYRDEYTCQLCGAKNTQLQIHHIKFRSIGGTDKPSNLLTLCTNCHTHESHLPGGKLYQLMIDGKSIESRTKQCDAMNKINKYLKLKYNPIETFGYITKIDRTKLGLEKTHYNDAFVISGGLVDNCDVVYIKQHKTKTRQLHKMSPQPFKRPNKNTEQVRENWRNDSIVKKGFRWKKGDSVRVGDQNGFITGLSNGYLYVRDIKGIAITKLTKTGKETNQLSYTQLEFKYRSNRWLYDYQKT